MFYSFLICSYYLEVIVSVLSFNCSFFFFLMAVPMEYGSSQVRNQIQDAATCTTAVDPLTRNLIHAYAVTLAVAVGFLTH